MDSRRLARVSVSIWGSITAAPRPGISSRLHEPLSLVDTDGVVSIVVSIVQVARLAQTVMERAFAKSGLGSPPESLG